MNGSITERLNPTGHNTVSLPPVAVEQVPSVVQEVAPTKWRMEGDLFSDEVGQAESLPVAHETAVGIGHIAARSGEVVSIDPAVLPPNSPTQLPKRVDPFLRPTMPGQPGLTTANKPVTGDAFLEHERRQAELFGRFASDSPNAVGAPRPASVRAAATRAPGIRPPVSRAQLEADDAHFSRMNGAA